MRPISLPPLEGQLFVIVTEEPVVLLEPGSQIRDNFLILGAGHVSFGWLCRATVEGAVLEGLQRSGRGALNIDACRKPWSSEAERLAALPKSMPSANTSLGTFETRDRSRENPEDFQSPLGRWPTNVVLVHHASCTEACSASCMVPKLGAAATYFPQFRSYPELLAWFDQLVQANLLARPQSASLTAAR